ncbi:MAG: hypothetical protein RLZZ53_194 [Acidobacteriota bacterium]|jgi:hypothetical protein
MTREHRIAVAPRGLEAVNRVESEPLVTPRPRFGIPARVQETSFGR